MKTTTNQVTTSMTFEVTVHLTATETADETGADMSDVHVMGVDVNGTMHLGWIPAIQDMNGTTQKGDWTDA